MIVIASIHIGPAMPFCECLGHAMPAHASPSKAPNRPVARFSVPCLGYPSLTMRKRRLGLSMGSPMPRPAARGHGRAPSMVGLARAHALPRRARAGGHEGGARGFGVGLGASHTRYKFDFAFQDQGLTLPASHCLSTALSALQLSLPSRSAW